MAFDDENVTAAGVTAADPGAADPGLVARVARIYTDVDALARLEPRDLDGADAIKLFDHLYELSDQLRAIAACTLPGIEADGLWATHGARTFTTWLAHRARLTHANAKRLTRLGRALREELTLTATAVKTGADGNSGNDSDSGAGGGHRIGLEHAQILTTIAATSDLRRQLLADPTQACGEQFLLDHARTLPADAFRNLTRRWAAAADPEADERGYTDATEREFLDIAPTTGGCHLSGFLTTEHGETLLIALDAITATPTTNDNRTHAQRRASALTNLARTTLDHALIGTRATIRPHLNILIDYPTLIALTTTTRTDTTPTDTTGTDTTGTTDLTPALAPALLNPAIFDNGQPVPRAVLDRLMCDSDISRTIFGPDSQLLDIGRTKRLFPHRLRRAIIARDTHCQYPTCTAPPRLCEGHHTKHWTRDHGNTDARQGILLCWHHHTHVHNTGIEIQWTPGTGWQFTNRHGQPLRQ